MHQVKARGELTKKVTKLMETVQLITEQIEELKTAPSTAQDIVCAFVTFDRWEDCEKAQKLYSGFLTGWLCIDHRFRWKQDEQEAESSGRPGPCKSPWGKRLRVKRAPEPVHILWENFGTSDVVVVIRRCLAAMVPLVLLASSVAAFIMAPKLIGSDEARCTAVVCDVDLQVSYLILA